MMRRIRGECRATRFEPGLLGTIVSIKINACIIIHRTRSCGLGGDCYSIQPALTIFKLTVLIVSVAFVLNKMRDTR